MGEKGPRVGCRSQADPRKKLTADNLAEGIRDVLAQPVKDAAEELGRKIQAESGAEAAARVVMGIYGV